MKKDPKERLGTNNGLDEILAHPWFNDISPDDVLNKKIEPEFKPKLSKDVFDVTNFDK